MIVVEVVIRDGWTAQIRDDLSAIPKETKSCGLEPSATALQVISFSQSQLSFLPPRTLSEVDEKVSKYQQLQLWK